MALTKEQEQAIREKIEFVRIRAERDESDFSRIIKWIVAGIKAYDELKDIEDVKAAVKAAKAESNDSSAYVVFRPHRGAFADAISAIRVFETKEQMLNKLGEEYGGKVAIDDDEVEDDRIGWLHSQYVTQKLKLRFGGTASVVIGICDYKTFKKG